MRFVNRKILFWTDLFKNLEKSRKIYFFNSENRGKHFAFEDNQKESLKKGRTFTSAKGLSS